MSSIDALSQGELLQDAATQEQAPQPSIAELYDRCIESFRVLLVILGAESCRAVQLGYIDTTQVGDEYGRFRIWGEQSRANLPEKARGSLDDTLRRDEEVKDIVTSTLLRLEAVLSQALPLSRKTEDDAASDLESVSSIDSSDNEDAPRKVPRISILLRHATDQISSLFELSSVLRRPTVEGKWIRSAAKSDSALSETFFKFDKAHVEENIRHWRGLTKAHFAPLIEEEAILDRARPGDDPVSWLSDRLARANTRRRAQLEYWADHPYGSVPSKSSEHTRHLSGADTVLQGRSQQTKDDEDASTPRPSTTQKRSDPSATTNQSFSTVAISDANYAATEAGRPRTVYAPSIGGQRQMSRVPDAPKASNEGQIICPYCGIELREDMDEKRDHWKRHVFRDLRPYVCTFQDCHTPEKLFVSRTDWIYHELQMHRRQFVCRDCDERFTNSRAMSEHLATAHGDAFTTTQIPIATSLCDRPEEEMSQQKCVLCSEEMSLVALQAHLATHMEDLSLFVLPLKVVEEEEISDGASNHVAAEPKHSRGSNTSIIVFEEKPVDLEDTRQNLQSIHELVNVEESTYMDKVALWADTEQEESAQAAGSHSTPANDPEPSHLDAPSLEKKRMDNPGLIDDEDKRPRRLTLFKDEQGEPEPLYLSPAVSLGDSEKTRESIADKSHLNVPGEIEEGVWGYLLPLSGSQQIALKTPTLTDPVEAVVRVNKQGPKSSRTSLPQGGYLIGRHPECDVVLTAPTISNWHCLLFSKTENDRVVAVVMDMSSNGTFVNEAILGRNQQRDLQDQDEIAITNDHRFVFRYPENLQGNGSGFHQQYTVLDKLGTGHFAEVYLCVEKATGARYAVKIFQRDSQAKIDGLNAEMAILNSLNHPNVQHTKASFVEAKNVYLVIEYAGQGELFNYIVSKTKLSETETRNLFRQLFRGVEYLHDRNIAHRDIKPENIMVADENLSRVWIVDFGLARVVGDEAMMTTLCGTPSYVAPEILANTNHRRYTKAVDIWSLGVVLYVCLCGFPPFSDELHSPDFPYTLSQQIRSGRFDYPSPYWDSVSDSALDLIDNMLVCDPRKRYTVKECMSHPWMREGEASEVGHKERAPERKRTLLGTLLGEGRLQSDRGRSVYVTKPDQKLPIRDGPRKQSLSDGESA